MAGAFLPAKCPASEDVEEDLQGKIPDLETLGWELAHYQKSLARYRARVARRLGVKADVLDDCIP
jgi:hypothetical protein